MEVEVFTLPRAMKLNSERFSLETNVKVHYGCVKPGDLKSTPKQIRLTSEKLTVEKNQQISKKSENRMYRYVG